MKLTGKILLAALACVVGTMAMGMLAGMLHLPSPSAPEGTTQTGMFVAILVGSVILVLGLTPIANGIGGNRYTRWMALLWMLYITCGVNTVIEASFFSSRSQGYAALLLHDILPYALLTLVLGLKMGSDKTPAGFPSRTAGQWIWRVAVAWIAFPIIYWTFGMCVVPFVSSYYQAGVQGLTIPPPQVIVAVQLVRSPLFLIASLPLIALWTGSRKHLFWTLGTAHAITVGIYGLAISYWLPTTLRIVHSIEITADSFAYAVVLVWLFARPKATGHDIERGKSAAANA